MSENGKIIQFPSPKQKKGEANFNVFIQQIHANDLTAAAQSLEEIMGISKNDAESATNFFKEHYDKSEAHVMLTMSIRGKINNNETNDALQLIYNCFGLQGPVALKILQALKKIAS